MNRAEALDALTTDVESRTGQLLDISHELHANPELCYEEYVAHEVLTNALADAGLDVERGAFGLDTAFRAVVSGGDGPTVAICCEYDALPQIGHACGHNIIAAAGLGAGLAAAQVAEQLGGTVVILGTPAEEGGGGKILMIERGAFDGVDAAMMVHPADADLDSFHAIAVHELHCEFHGEAAHAAAAPHRGRNALDAAVSAYVNVAMLRQHIESNERIHGIFTHGGDKPNVVPHRSSMAWYVRSGTAESLRELEPRFVDCLVAGATATGCTVDHEWVSAPYEDLVVVPSLAERYAANAATRGRHVESWTGRMDLMGSTDMGNVSHVVPSIHPMIAVAPPGVAIHTQAFAEHTAAPAGDRAVIDGAVILARTVVDLWCDAELMSAVRGDFGE